MANKRVELSIHTKKGSGSLLSLEECYKELRGLGHQAVGITDVDSVQSFPDLFAPYCTDGIVPVYGLDTRWEGHHRQSRFGLKLFVKNQQGMTNLYKLTSKLHNQKVEEPILSYDDVEKFREGLLIGSGGEKGEILSSVLGQPENKTLDPLFAFYDFVEIFPPRQYLNYIRSSFASQKITLDEMTSTIEWMVKEAIQWDIPVVGTGNVYFSKAPEPQVLGDDLSSPAIPSTAGPLRDGDEMMKAFDFLNQEHARYVVFDGPETIVEQCGASMDPSLDSEYLTIPGSQAKCRAMPEENFSDWKPRVNKLVHQKSGERLEHRWSRTRMEKEYVQIKFNNLTGILNFFHKIINPSTENNSLYIQPIGSLWITYLLGWTDINPLPPHYFCSDCKRIEPAKSVAKIGLELPDKDCPECGREYKREGFDLSPELFFPNENFLGFDRRTEFEIQLSSSYERFLGRVSEDSDEQVVFGKNSSLSSFYLVPGDRTIHEFTPTEKEEVNGREINRAKFSHSVLEDSLCRLQWKLSWSAELLTKLQEKTHRSTKNIPLNDLEILSLFSEVYNSPWNSERLPSVLGLGGFSTPEMIEALNKYEPKHFSELMRIAGFVWGGGWGIFRKERKSLGKTTLDYLPIFKEDVFRKFTQSGISETYAVRLIDYFLNTTADKIREKDIAELESYGIDPWYIKHLQVVNGLYPKGKAVWKARNAVWLAYFKLHFPTEFYCEFANIHQKKLQGIELVSDEVPFIKSTLLSKNSFVWKVMREAMFRGIKFKSLDSDSNELSFQVIDDCLIGITS